MRTSTFMKLSGLLAVCVVAVLVWSNHATAKPIYQVGKSIPAIELNQLQKNYGIHFVASPKDANQEPISAQQAVAVANEGYVKQVTMEAIFGYMTINSRGNAVFVQPTTDAGKRGHGVVNDYPVWLVSRNNAPLFIGGPMPRTKQQLKEREKLLNAKGSYLTFVDATNGQRFFTVTVSDNQ